MVLLSLRLIKVLLSWHRLRDSRGFFTVWNDFLYLCSLYWKTDIQRSDKTNTMLVGLYANLNSVWSKNNNQKMYFLFVLGGKWKELPKYQFSQRSALSDPHLEVIKIIYQQLLILFYLDFCSSLNITFSIY